MFSRAIVISLTFLAAFTDARMHRRAAHTCPGKNASKPAAVNAPPPLNVVKGSIVSIGAPAPTGTPLSAPPVKAATSAKFSSSAKIGNPNSATDPPAPAPTSKPVAGAMGNLFPVSGFSKSWSTSPSANNALALADPTFRPTNVLNSVVHTYQNAPDGKKSMKAHYPAGSYNFGNYPQGGFSFYAPGPAPVDLTTAKEATFGYSVFFPKGFAFNLGGKLPGLYGGNNDADSIGCSGGSRSEACFSARLMWRSDGAGEFYTYLPPSFAANKRVCNVAPQSDCNPTYGASVGRGSFTFATGAWTTVSERVRLNDAGQSNGEIQLFVNGKSVINVNGLVLRNSAAGRIRGMQMQTFFGGSHSDFASPKDQDVFFSDFSAAITETL